MIDHYRSKKKRSEPENRLEVLYRQLRERICLLDYVPGSRLNEGTLCAEFGISRTPIRRVLTRLEAEGLIETHHGDGTYVTTLAPDLLAEIYALRIELAPLISKLNPIPPSPDTIDRLRATCASIRALKGRRDLRRFAQLNIEHYLEITTLIGNRPLREITERLFIQTSRIWLMELPHLDWDSVIESTCVEIDRVIAALESGDIEAAGLFSRLNIFETMHRYVDGQVARLRND